MTDSPSTSSSFSFDALTLGMRASAGAQCIFRQAHHANTGTASYRADVSQESCFNAPYVSLSTRNARNSEFDRMRAARSARPLIGPPEAS